jgi:hypothetical protein
MVVPGELLTYNGTKLLPFPSFDSSGQAGDRRVLPQSRTKHLPNSFSDVISGPVARPKV